MTDQFLELVAGASIPGEEMPDPKSKPPDAFPAQTNFVCIAVEVKTNKVHLGAGSFDLMHGKIVADE